MQLENNLHFLSAGQTLKLLTVKVVADWIDYNEHMTEYRYNKCFAADLDLAERRDVAEAGVGADVQYFAVNAFTPTGLAVTRKPGRAIPQAGVDESGAVLFRPIMQRRFAHRLEVLTGISTC